MHVIKLNGYNATVDNGEKLILGTFDSYGVEQLQIVKGLDWENLSVIATFNPPNKKPVQVVVDSVTGIVDVPKEATSDLYGVGTIVFVGLADGVQRISADCEYIVRKHSNASGTEPAEPTPSVVEQILTEAQNANVNSADAKKLATDAKDIAQSVRTDADNGKLNGKDGTKGDKGDTGTTPQLKIGEDNLWNVSYDNGETWVSLGVKATGDTGAAGKDGVDGLTPHIGENGNWWIGNTDTGVSAKGIKGDTGEKGADGVSPTAAVTQTDDGAEFTVTDASGTTTAVVKNGVDGVDGKNGISPTVQVETIDGGHRVTFTDVSDSHAVDVLDGKPGKDGVQIDDAAVSEDKPWSSKHIIDMLCPPLEESGNPVVCYPVAGYPLGVTASWEPVQEGEGEPYPAGGGPNKLNVAGVVSNRTISGITFKVNADGTIGVNGTSTAICFLNPNTKFNKAYLQKIPAGTYRLDFAQTALAAFLFGYYEDGTEAPIVYVGNAVTYAQDVYVGPQIRVAAGATVNTKVRLMLHTGTSAPSAWAPYENIRPIVGRDSVTVNLASGVKNWRLLTLTGTENWRFDSVYYVLYNAVRESGICTTGISSHFKYRYAYAEECVFVTESAIYVGRALTVQFATLADWVAYLAAQYAARTPVQIAYKRNTPHNMPSAKGIYFAEQPAQSGSGNPSPTNIRPILLDGAVKDGGTNVLTLPETVYGGSVDTVSGEGQETWKIITIDAKEIKFVSRSNDVYWNLPDRTAVGVTRDSKIVCSHFISKKFTVNEPYEFLFTQPTNFQGLFSNVDELNDYCAAQYAAGTPVQIAYQLLREPVPFTATGAQLLPALAGVNTVITDADSVAVTGRADPIKRIEDLEAAVASIN